MLKTIKTMLKSLGFRRYPGLFSPRPIDPMIRASQIMSPQMMQSVEWKHSDLALKQLEQSHYFRVWSRFEGGYKKYSYFELYDRLFSEFIGRRPNVLEIGVYKGASIRAWSEFFGEGSTIVGIDINPDCAQFDNAGNGIHVRIGSQVDTFFLAKLYEEFGAFDIIIDDGSHLTGDVIATFNHAFLKCLKDGGVYFVEDLNTSYWREYRTSKYSAMDMMLSLGEMLQWFYVRHHHQDYQITNYPDRFMTPLICTLVQEVRIFDSAVAVYKKIHNPPLVFHT